MTGNRFGRKADVVNGREQHNRDQENPELQDLKRRLRSVGGAHQLEGPDTGAIMHRETAMARNRRLISMAAVVVLVVSGGLIAVELARGQGPGTAVIAGQLADPDGDPTGEPGPAETTRKDDGSTVDETGPTPLENGPGDTDDTDDSGDGDTGATVSGRDAVEALDPPSPSSLSDGVGGWLTVKDDGTLSRLAPDGAESVIRLPDRGGWTQRLVTDLAPIDGTPYLLMDEFVSRDDLAFERVQEVASRYGLTIDPDSDYEAALAEVATAQELDSLNHFEVSILAVDVISGRVTTVERRVINSIADPGWVYNGHITANGSRLVVMRELWQGACMYAEALTLDGAPVDDPITDQYRKPAGLDTLTFEEISAMQRGEATWPEPCLTLDVINDGGQAALGTQAGPGNLEVFRQAWFQAGL